MNVDLLVYKDGQPLRTVSVSLPVIIGRGTGATFTIKHPLLSRKHCEVFEDNGSIQIRDLASLNGTFVNGKRVDSTASISSGDQIKLGAVVMDIKYSEGQTEGDPAAEQKVEDQEDAFDLGAVETADTEVMGSQEIVEDTVLLPQEDPDETADFPRDEVSESAGDESGMVDLGDFEVSSAATESDAEQPALDLADFEVSPPSTPPSDEMLDLGDFEVTAQSAEDSAAQDRPSLTDLADAVPPATETPTEATSDDPWSAPAEAAPAPADDDDLDAFLKDLD